MEFEILSIVLILLSFLPFFFIAIRLQKRDQSSLQHPNQIPGPKKLPLIGNLHLLVADSRPPHQTFRDLSAKYGPLMHLQLGQVPFLIVSSVEAAKQVLKIHDITFANRPPGHVATPLSYNHTSIGFAPYGNYWRHLRKICTLELLSAKRVKSFRHLREDEDLKLANLFASNGGGVPVNLSENTNLSSFDLVTRATIGSTTNERKAITSAIKQVTKLASGFSIADLYPSIKGLPLITGLKFKVERIFRRLDRTLGRIIDEHRAAEASRNDVALERSEDLVDILLKFQEDGAELPLTTDNVKAVLQDMFTAGGETSANVVVWAMSEMMKNPTIMKRAQEEVRKVFDSKGYVDEAEFHELKYLKLVIKETMRLHPPVPLLVPRYNNEKCDINGYEIPAKTTVLINAWALARDPKYWNDAEKFVPERFMESSIDYKGNNLEYTPFGAGRRMCPGISFGMANVESTLCMMLYHFDWEMPNGMKNEDLDMTESAGLTLKRKHDLRLIPTVRRPLQLLK